MMTNNTYAQFWKKTSTTQHKLLLAFDTRKGRMHLEYFQARVPQPKEITDYKSSTIVFDTKQVHLADQMDLRRQTGEIVFFTLAHASSISSKLHVSLNKVQNQLKLEKISSFAKDNIIKSLEELVLKIGYDPFNVKATEEKHWQKLRRIFGWISPAP
jgi:lysyl-tRNA synthetase class II